VARRQTALTGLFLFCIVLNNEIEFFIISVKLQI